MLKAEADNSYLDLGIIFWTEEEVIVNNFMKFYKNCLKKNNQNKLLIVRWMGCHGEHQTGILITTKTILMVFLYLSSFY